MIWYNPVSECSVSSRNNISQYSVSTLTQQQWVCQLVVLALPVNLEWDLVLASECSLSSHPRYWLFWQSIVFVRTMVPSWALSTWISTACLILLILLLSACFFFILILSAMSSCSRSWMSYRHVSHCIMWMYVWSSNIFGRVKKLLVLMRTFSSSSWSAGWGAWHFRERVFIAGGDITISTIGSNPRGQRSEERRVGKEC